jgi:hypothetical protein
MTGCRDKLDARQAIALNTQAMPLAGRMQTSLMLGDLVVAGAQWARAHVNSHFAARAGNVSAKRPPEPCGAC